MLRPLTVFAEDLHRWCLTAFYMWLCLRRRFPPLGLRRGILNSSCVLILLIHKNTNIRRWNVGLTPRPHFLEGQLIHLVDKAKNVWLIVGQLPIKAEWWSAPLELRDFSRSNKHKDSHKESPWFPALPPPFPAFLPPLPAFPPWFPTFPPWFPTFPPWFTTFPPWFLVFPPWFPAFPSFPHSVPRFPIPAFTDSPAGIKFQYMLSNTLNFVRQKLQNF